MIVWLKQGFKNIIVVGSAMKTNIGLKHSESHFFFSPAPDYGS